MRILVFVLLLLTANCFLDDYWEREVSQEAQEEKGRFGSFINQSHGVVDLYYIMRNGSFMVKIKQEDGQVRRKMKMLVTPLEDLGEDRRAARPAIISCEYIQQSTDSQVKNTTKQYLVGNITFLPHEQMVLASKGVVYEVIFWKLNKFLHVSSIILNGIFFVMVNFLFWQLKMEFQYNGFQLLSLMMRWLAKMLLFGKYNGWNYYFPEDLKGLYLFVLVLWGMVEIWCFFDAFRRNKNICDRNISLIFFLMVLLPDGFFYYCAFLVLVYECGCVRSKKLMSFDILLLSTIFILLVINKMVVYSSISSVIFFTSDKESTLNTIIFLLYMGLAMFLVHFKVPPHVFIFTLFAPYFACCCAKQCVVCHQYHRKLFFIEEFLLMKGCRILFIELVLTPCGHTIMKECLKKHVQGVKSCPIDGQALSDDWISNNLGDLGEVEPGPILPSEIDVAAGVVNFAEAAQSAQNIENSSAEAVEQELQEEMQLNK